ncbi:MAG TPA: glutamate--tRNA ligase, partial [Elusimicrobiales bacterium]|nr:glutamate--tRNA ligase [Elusimicrobiales bacterium]
GGIYGAASSCAAARGAKIGAVMWPLRIALSGLAVTPTGAVEIAELLGKAESLRRIGLALKRL